MIAPLAIFFLTYVAISVRRLPWVPIRRPSAALAGAVAMVLFGGLSLDDAFHAIDLRTITLLLGMLVISGYLAEARFFAWLAHRTVTRARTARTLLVALVLVSGALSAVLVNDTVCLVFAPFVLAVAEEAHLEPLPLLLAVGMGSNVGGAATYTGTPQTMMIGDASGVPYAHYALRAAPVAALGLVALAGLLLFFFRAELPKGPLRPRSPAAPALDGFGLARALVVLAATVLSFWLGAGLALGAITGAAVLLLVGGRDPNVVLARVDWSLLLFFAALFVVMGGVAHTGVAEQSYEVLAPFFGRSPEQKLAGFGAFTVLGSNLVSNVPFVMLAKHWIPRFADPTRAWYVLALASTFAGNLATVGSVANLIVLEAARDRVSIGFFRFMIVGVPVTLVTLAIALVAAWILP